MREILFKAKIADTKEWIEGLLNKMWGLYHIIPLDCENVAYPVDEETICQYIGLEACWTAFENEPQECDVWEHDLLVVNYEGKKVIAKVMYDAGMFILVSDKFADSYIPLFDVVQSEYGCSYIDAEHVGNIFDNPELLEQ